MGRCGQKLWRQSRLSAIDNEKITLGFNSRTDVRPHSLGAAVALL